MKVDLKEFLIKNLDLAKVDETEEWINSLCPTHKERRRSFGVHKSTLVTKCFVCGNRPLFQVLVEANGVSKIQALSLIRNNLDKDYLDAQRLGVSKKSYLKYKKLKRDRVQGEIEEELRYYNKVYAKYLLDMGFTKDTLKLFKIFYNYDKQLLLFPVFLKGKHIGTMYRNPYATGEYFYSVGFDKTKYVYNIDNIKRGSVVIVLESPKDVAWMYQSGFKNCVSFFGTNYGPEQVAAVKSITNKVILAMDNDRDGRIANKKLFVDFEGLVKYIVDFGKYKDPGDMDSEYIATVFSNPKFCIRL
jgi:DNA primase